MPEQEPAPFVIVAISMLIMCVFYSILVPIGWVFLKLLDIVDWFYEYRQRKKEKARIAAREHARRKAVSPHIASIAHLRKSQGGY